MIPHPHAIRRGHVSPLGRPQLIQPVLIVIPLVRLRRARIPPKQLFDLLRDLIQLEHAALLVLRPYRLPEDVEQIPTDLRPARDDRERARQGEEVSVENVERRVVEDREKRDHDRVRRERVGAPDAVFLAVDADEGRDGACGRETLLGCFLAQVCRELAGGRDGGLGFAVFRGEEGVDAEAIAREADHDGVVAHPILRSVSRLAAKGLKWEGGLT